MSTVINGSSPSITFSDGTTQTTSAFGTGSNLYTTGTNIGIGTNSPSNKLTIQADATGASFADNGIAQLLVEGLTDYTKRIGVGIDTTNNVGVIQAQKYGTGTYPLALNPAGGNVGIGTNSPAFKLQVSGAQNANDIVSTNTTINSSLRMQMIDVYASIFTTASYPLTFGTNNTERMRLDSSGNFLVKQSGTTNGTGASLQSNLATGSVGISGSFATVWTIPSGTQGIFTVSMGGNGQYGGGALFYVAYGQFPAGGNAYVVKLAGPGGDQSGYSWSWQLASNGQFQMRNDTNGVQFTPTISMLTLG